uniref:Uncharacterized protein n=1 Tax=Podoviridae sp. ctzMH52 TaxID=2826596 RepID=A0A8S5N2V1_9CAUD|nr:MAG TPA: hypothetical protein [Podoviridae sp. ctzMH52]
MVLQREQHRLEHECEHRLPPPCRPRSARASPCRLAEILPTGRGLVSPNRPSGRAWI